MARLIDADALVEDIGNEIDKPRKVALLADYNHFYCAGMRNVIRLVKRLPTVDDIKHGHWSQYAEPHEDGKGLYICSVCNEMYVMYDDEYKFCPNCGCKMDAKPGGDSLDGEKAK